MRKYLYLITDSPEQDKIGGVDIREAPYARAEKNKEVPIDKRNIETNETWTESVVSLGYVDFENQQEYESEIHSAMKGKLNEIDEQHLVNAGLDPEEVLG